MNPAKPGNYITINRPVLNQHRRFYFSVFILLCLLLALVSSQNSAVRWIDAQMFRISSLLLPEKPAGTDYRVVLLDEARLQQPEGIQDLRFLLRKLKSAGAAEVVWLSADFPRMDYEPLQRLADVTEIEPVEQQAWQPTEGERNKLAWMLENHQVFLTQYDNMPEDQGKIPYSANLIYQQDWRKYIPQLFLPEAKTFRQLNTRFPYLVYPFEYRDRAQQSLVWYSEDRSYSIPDLSLALYSRLENSSQLRWNEAGWVSLDHTDINTSLSARVYRYFSELTGRHSKVTRFTLDNAMKMAGNYFNNKLVLIGQDMQQLQALADALNSLQSKATYFTPAISWWLQPALLLVVAIYLLFLLPLLSRQSGVFLGAFLLLGVIACQPVLLILKGIWWPTINILVFMVVGQIGVYIYLSGREQLNDLLLKQHVARFELGHYQYQKGDYDAAVTNLLKSHNQPEAIDDLYEIALSFERKRQYDRAMQLYAEISVRQKNYKDVEKRLNSMTGMSGNKNDVTTPFQGQKTLVMPEMELPEFGRYKIEKELGRGAMGVVYLGRDPKINRQVAIKTLDYTQFSSSEVKSVKSRFFREAEAAGRLSHSNIVTVYDVGEEEGFAFIAMDYVNGVPLSTYTRPDNLLPVAEVYRIIKVVAEALDYAHAQNIVHRDIKPGNIMYNPDSKQLKITDFGIARITDSVKTRTGSFMGSPSYMAPEQMTETSVDGRADLYALGVSFYQLLTGKLPFEADSLGKLAYKITNQKHTPVRDIRPELPSSATRIINKALQKKPEKRFATGKEMAKALQRGMPS